MRALVERLAWLLGLAPPHWDAAALFEPVIRDVGILRRLDFELSANEAKPVPEVG